MLTASAERLEQLPGASATALLGSDPHPEEPGKLDQWLDDMKERAERPGKIILSLSGLCIFSQDSPPLPVC